MEQRRTPNKTEHISHNKLRINKHPILTMSTHPGKAQVQACQAKPEGKPQAQARSKTVTFSPDVSVSSAGSSWSGHQDKVTSLEESYWYTEQETFQMLADTYREALRLSQEFWRRFPNLSRTSSNIKVLVLRITSSRICRDMLDRIA